MKLNDFWSTIRNTKGNLIGNGLGLILSNILSKGLCDSPECTGLKIMSTPNTGTIA